VSVLVPRTAPHTPRGSAGRWRFLTGALTCLAMMLAGPTVAGASAEPAPPPVRILIVGDSVTQGSAGDWTWRYRLWEHLTRAGADFDFVGPRTDLLDRNANTYGSHGYLDPGFDQDHAALWGNALGMPAFSISQLVADYQPDVVVELLGVNDLNGLGASVATVDDELGDFVGDARAQNPDVAVVLGALGSDWISKVPEFNAQLPGLAHSLDTPTSRVVAAAPPHLVQGVDTYEFVHPSATGEVKIAADVADALSTLGVGPPAARPLPVVPNGPRAPASLTATAGETSASLSWTLPLGADRVYVEQRDLDAADPSWERATDPVVLPEIGTDLCCLVPGDRYRFRLRAAKGTAVAEDIASNVVGLRPGVPSAVRSLKASPRHHGFRATWSAATLATWYQVRWWPAGHPHQWTQERTSRLGLTVSHQKAGRTYVVSVLGEHNGFLGPATRTEVVPKR
jgi:lysophospholipase L1-like esterase